LTWTIQIKLIGRVVGHSDPDIGTSLSGHTFDRHAFSILFASTVGAVLGRGKSEWKASIGFQGLIEVIGVSAL